MSTINVKRPPRLAWDALEIQFLRENYKTLGAEKCAEALGRTLNATRTQACYLNLTRHIQRNEVERVKAMMRGRQPIALPAPVREVSETPAVIVTDFIKPLTKAQLMARRA